MTNSKTPKLQNSVHRCHKLVFLFVVASLSLPETALSYCISANGFSEESNSQKDYKIRYRHLPEGFDVNSAQRATERAAQLWNDYANSGTFRYAGSVTSYHDLPQTLTDCVFGGKMHHLVVFEESSPNSSWGVENKRCFHNGVSYFSRIQVFAKNAAGSPFPWTDGPSGTHDIVRNISHEFGHTLNIGHAQDAGRWGGYEKWG